MEHRRLYESNGQRTYAVVLASGEEVMGSLKKICNSATHFCSATIGALSDAVLQYFDWDKKDYIHIPVCEQVEVASLLGDIAQAPSGEPALHVHLVVGRRDGSAMAGHLAEAHVRPTLEVIINEVPAHLRKKEDPQTGLALIHPTA